MGRDGAKLYLLKDGVLPEALKAGCPEEALMVLRAAVGLKPDTFSHVFQMKVSIRKEDVYKVIVGFEVAPVVLTGADMMIEQCIGYAYACCLEDELDADGHISATTTRTHQVVSYYGMISWSHAPKGSAIVEDNWQIVCSTANQGGKKIKTMKVRVPDVGENSFLEPEPLPNPLQWPNIQAIPASTPIGAATTSDLPVPVLPAQIKASGLDWAYLAKLSNGRQGALGKAEPPKLPQYTATEIQAAREQARQLAQIKVDLSDAAIKARELQDAIAKANIGMTPTTEFEKSLDAFIRKQNYGE